jgi:Fe-S-cluster containining protein
VWVEPQERGDLPLLADGDQMQLAQDERGRCVLLTGDNLCSLHRDHGWRSKPRACRQFPFFLLETPDGIQVGLSFRCTAVQQDLGQDWAEHESSLRELVESGVPRVGFESVSIGSYPLDWFTYKSWEADWIEALPHQLTAAVALSLSQALPLDGPTLERLVLLLSASAVGFLESDDPDQAVAVAAAVRSGQSYLSPRRGRIPALPDPFGAELDPQFARYLAHVLERKSLWMGRNFLGRLLMFLAARPMLSYYQQLEGFWAAVDRVEGEWLAHRRGLGVLEEQFASTLLQLC